jgi:hypothetical protein
MSLGTVCPLIYTMDRLESYLYLDNIIRGKNASPMQYLAPEHRLFEGQQLLIARYGGKKKKIGRGYTKFDQFYEAVHE